MNKVLRMSKWSKLHASVKLIVLENVYYKVPAKGYYQLNTSKLFGFWKVHQAVTPKDELEFLAVLLLEKR